MFAFGESNDNCPATGQLDVDTGTVVAASGSHDRQVASKVAGTSTSLTTIPVSGKFTNFSLTLGKWRDSSQVASTSDF